MKRLHVSLKVKELEESIRFYSTLFAAAPAVTKADYAKWMLDDPRVNFSIVAAPDATHHGVEHLGIQAEDGAELAEIRERIDAIQGEVFDEGETTCCYAESDKTWVTDPVGVTWEAFHTTGAAEVLGAPASPEGGACGEPGSCC